MTGARDARWLRVAGAALACALLALAGAVRARPAAAASPRGVPILLYHRISAPPGHVPGRALYVAPALLRRQVAALARAGYHGVTLTQVWRHWHGGARLPSKPIVVSFDDGYASQYRRGLPVLRRYRWPGLLNLQWNRVGVPGGLTRAQVRALAGAGWEIADHSFTHPDLTRVDAATLTHEVADSRTTMQRALGLPIAFFCYPYGHVDATVETAVRDAGFLGATTTTRGLASPQGDPYALNRIIASGTASPAALLALVRRAR